MLAALTFATPLGALAVLAAVVPLFVYVYAARSAARAARLLGLAPAPRRAGASTLALAVGACVCLGLAAAQPGLRTTHRQTVRTRSEITYVVDMSRSMAAAASPGSPTRLARARTLVRRLHDATLDVPSGIAGLTDRVLPYVFPTSSKAVFDATLAQSVMIESPPPQEVSHNATSFAALSSLAGDHYFDRAATRRTCVVVTDGETSSYDASSVADAIGGSNGCRLLVVRVGGGGERVYGADGVPEPGYAPDPAAAAKADALAQAAGGRSFAGRSRAAAIAALRGDAETGPTRSAVASSTVRALAPWLALAAFALTLAFALTRISPGGFRGVHSFRHAKIGARS